MFALSQFTKPQNLAPFMSDNTINFHYGKHLDTYIKNLNGFIAGTEFGNMPLTDIIKKSDGKVFNNAAQIFNHDFFFCTLKKDSAEKIPSEITNAIPNFVADFTAAATGVFGSGWAWLIRDNDGTLKITTTANADTPIAHNQTPILCIDVWEHAYYLDYQNRRADFIAAFLEHMVDWVVVGQRLKKN